MKRYPKISVGAFLGLVLIGGIATLEVRAGDPDTIYYYGDGYGNGHGYRGNGNRPLTAKVKPEDSQHVLYLLNARYIQMKGAAVRFYFDNIASGS